MKQLLHLLIVLIFSSCYSQNRAVTTVYFEFDKHKLPEDQIQVIVDFMKTVDTTKIESIQIFGYCDDRGAKDYNYDLSKKRVMTVQDILTANGFNQNKIVIIEGKGRVIIQKDDIEVIFNMVLEKQSDMKEFSIFLKVLGNECFITGNKVYIKSYKAFLRKVVHLCCKNSKFRPLLEIFI